MPYMLLMMEPPGQRRTRTELEGREVYAHMQRFADALQARGQLLAVESLGSHANAVRVQVRGWVGGGLGGDGGVCILLVSNRLKRWLQCAAQSGLSHCNMDLPFAVVQLKSLPSG